MRLLLTVLVFLASLVAAVFVHVAKADAAWETPQQIDSGNKPKVRFLEDGRPYIAYSKDDSVDPSQLPVFEGNEPTRRVKVPRAGLVTAPSASEIAGGRSMRLRRLHTADQASRLLVDRRPV